MTSIDNNPVSQDMDALVALIEAGLHQIDLGQKSIEFQAQQHMIHLATIQDRLDQANRRKWRGRFGGFGLGIASSLVATEISVGRVQQVFEQLPSRWDSLAGKVSSASLPVWWVAVPPMLALVVLTVMIWIGLKAREARRAEKLHEQDMQELLQETQRHESEAVSKKLERPEQEELDGAERVVDAEFSEAKFSLATDLPSGFGFGSMRRRRRLYAGVSPTVHSPVTILESARLQLTKALRIAKTPK